MLLGLSSYTFGWAVGAAAPPPEAASGVDEHGLLDRCAQHGMKLLQIGDNLPLHTFDAPRLDRLAQRAAREGVQLEVGARRLTPRRVAEYATLSRRLGARLLRFVIDDTDYQPEPGAVVEVLREMLPSLEGLTLGLENHDRFSCATLRGILDTVGSERLGVCLDTANSLGCGEGLETVLSTLAPLAVNLHIKDFQVERLPYLMGFTVSGRPAGMGQLDVPALLRRLASVPRCQTAVLELWTPPGERLADSIARESLWAAQSLDYLKPFFV